MLRDIGYRESEFRIEIVMHGKKRSLLVATPSWGDVYIASGSATTILELFWTGHRVLSANERNAALAWLRAEGWFAYAGGGNRRP
jgi:hypothetical protein